MDSHLLWWDVLFIFCLLVGDSILPPSYSISIPLSLSLPLSHSVFFSQYVTEVSQVLTPRLASRVQVDGSFSKLLLLTVRFLKEIQGDFSVFQRLGWISRLPSYMIIDWTLTTMASLLVNSNYSLSSSNQALGREIFTSHQIDACLSLSRSTTLPLSLPENSWVKGDCKETW